MNKVIALVGGGLVAKTMMRVLHERGHKCDLLFGSEDDVTITPWGKMDVHKLTHENIGRIHADYVLMAVDAAISREYAPLFAALGSTVIDNSSAFRMDDNVPLVIPEINPASAMRSPIISNPNCTTIQILTALAPIYRQFGIHRMIVSTYQSVSGGGYAALSDLLHGNSDSSIKNNMIAKIDEFNGDYTLEELKIINETHKILSPSIRICATCVRVPLPYCHGASVNIKLSRPATVAALSECLSASPGIRLKDVPTPKDAFDQDDVFVGRLRRDKSDDNSFCMWIVADNLRKGAATNAIQILDILKEGL